MFNFFVKKIKDADIKAKGSNIISTNDVLSCFYFSPTAVHQSDITIVIGYYDGDNAGSILLFCYHKHLKVPDIMQDGRKKNIQGYHKASFKWRFGKMKEWRRIWHAALF